MDPIERHEIALVLSHLVVHKTVRESSGNHAICTCPFCGKPKHLYVNTDRGVFDCKRCGRDGTIFAIADELGIRVRGESVRREQGRIVAGMKRLGEATGEPPRPKKSIVPMQAVVDRSARVLKDGDEEGEAVRAYLAERGIGPEAIEHFKLSVAYLPRDKDETERDRAQGTGRLWVDRDGRRVEVGVGISYVDGGRVVLMKMRNLARGKEGRRFTRTKGGSSSLFHVDAIRDRKRVVLVEGEMDAISLWQVGVTDVASTSIGANARVPDDWKIALADADDIVIWYDRDESGQDARAAMISALGVDRCRIAEIPDDVRERVRQATGKEPKDANDLLVAGEHEAMRAIVSAARSIESGDIVRAGSLIDAVREKHSAMVASGDGYLGAQTPWKGVNALIRGIRTGEIVCVTGQPGQGKSTFVDDLSFFLAESGNPVLKCSFENGPSSIAESMLIRYTGLPVSHLLEADPSILERASQDVDGRDVFVLDHAGEIELDDLIGQIRYARRRLGCRYVFVDHVGYIRRPRGVDRHEHLDEVWKKLGEVAKTVDVGIVVVSHQNRDADMNTIAGGRTLAGGGAGERETWTGITVWRQVDAFGSSSKAKMQVKDPTGRKLDLTLHDDQSLVYVWKVRHKEGRIGSVILDFSSSTARFYDVGQRPGEGAEQDDMFDEDRRIPGDGVDGVLPF